MANLTVSNDVDSLLQSADKASMKTFLEVPGGSDWELMETQTALDSASLHIDGIFGAGYEWRVVASIVPASVNVVMWLRLRASGSDLGTTEVGRSYETFVGLTNASSSARSATDGVIPVGVTMASGLLQNIDAVLQPNNADSRSTVFIGSLKFNTSSNEVSGHWQGNVQIVDPNLDGIKVLFSSGNITSGTLRVYRRPSLPTS